MKPQPKILVNCLETGDDLHSADIVGLSYVLAEQLDTLKERIAEIRTNVYGI